VWDVVNRDGTICDPSTPGPQCLRIEIQQDTNGAFHGTIRLEAPPNADGGIQKLGGILLQGPFAPATDPNVGYPTTLNPGEYVSAEDGCSNVDYRLLDPVFAGATFSFWFSPYDLWTGWCALQTPYAWNVRGQTKYACVPQTADSSTTDFGKLVLCTNANDESLCTDSTGLQGPCVCLDDAGVIDTTLTSPLCSNSVCECTASHCRASLRSTGVAGPGSATLTLNGDELSGLTGGIGPNAFGSNLAGHFTFRKVHP
jgi:hypothetical protein